MAAFPKLVLTNAGIALQTKVQGGATLELTNIQMGSGQLNGQPIGPLTALISSNATVPIQSGQAIGQNTYQVEGFFTNADLSAGFWWREIGIFANDPDNGEILYAYANAGDAGDYIPTVTDQRIEKYIYFSMTLANATTVTVTIPQTDTYVLQSTVGQANGVAGLGENGAVPVAQGGTGATTPQAALANLGGGVRPNLLDNAIFIDGGSQQGGGQLPVNQRGQTSYTAGGYTVDRWSLTGSAAKITVQADGIYYEKTADATSYSIWEQKLPLGELEGKELAVSVLVDDVCYSDTIAAGWTYSNGVVLKQFFINNGSKQMRVSVSCDADNILIFRFYYGGSTAAATTGFLLQAAKLEEGDTQTLAYQDDTGAWQLLPQPESDYATQLAKCKYYATMIASENILRAAASYVSGSYIYFTIPLDVAMRQGNPTIVSSEDLTLYASITGNAQEGFSFSAQNNGNCVTLAAAKTSHGLTNGMLQMEKVLLSREL